MKRQQNYINTIISSKDFFIEPSLFQKYTSALGYDTKIADKLEEHIPTSFFSALFDSCAIFEKLKIEPEKILITKEKITLGKNIKAGETLSLQTIILDLSEQQAENCPLGFIEATTYGKCKNGQVCLKIHKVIVVRGGFKR